MITLHQVADMQASMEFKLPAQVRKKGKWVISSCNLLDVHSQGHTREQAERNLKDALATFLLSCYERGTLEVVLREAGFVPAVGRQPKLKSSVRGRKEVTVPLPFSIERGHPRAASA
jgi:predicted RNase H-like HicB family nuclease